MRNRSRTGRKPVPNDTGNMRLTEADRKDIESCMALCPASGYDRITTSAIVPYPGFEAVALVCAYRSGEDWATWAFARIGDTIGGWSALTGEDLGMFPSMAEALRSALLGDPAHGKRGAPPQT